MSRISSVVWVGIGVAFGLALGPTGVLADVPASALVTFVDGTQADADEVNANFEALRVAVNEVDARATNTLQVLGRSASNIQVEHVGQSWVDLPGTEITFMVPAGVTTRFNARGSVVPGVDAAPGTSENTHCGFRVVVDGAPQGHPDWGDVILGCSEPADVTAPAGWWCPWTLSRDVALAPGSHDAKLQMTGWGPSAVSCRIDNFDYSRAILDVLAY